MFYIILLLILLLAILIGILGFLIFFLYNTIRARGVPFVRSVDEVKELLLEHLEMKE